MALVCTGDEVRLTTRTTSVSCSERLILSFNRSTPISRLVVSYLPIVAEDSAHVEGHDCHETSKRFRSKDK